MVCLRGIVLTLGLCLLASVGWAHPHVFITSQLTLVFKEKKPVQLDVEWAFDEAFSSLVLTDYDSDMDAVFSPEETSVIRQEAFDYLKESSYFTFICHSGVKRHAVAPTSFECLARKGIVYFRFSVPVSPPPSASSPVRISQYDPSNYNALFLASGSPLIFKGDVPETIDLEIRENPDETYYFDMLHPIEAVISFDGPGA